MRRTGKEKNKKTKVVKKVPICFLISQGRRRASRAGWQAGSEGEVEKTRRREKAEGTIGRYGTLGM